MLFACKRILPANELSSKCYLPANGSCLQIPLAWKWAFGKCNLRTNTSFLKMSFQQMQLAHKRLLPVNELSSKCYLPANASSLKMTVPQIPLPIASCKDAAPVLRKSFFRHHQITYHQWSLKQSHITKISMFDCNNVRNKSRSQHCPDVCPPQGSRRQSAIIAICYLNIILPLYWRVIERHS